MYVLTHTLIQPFIDYLRFEKRYSVHTIISYETDLLEFFSYLNNTFGEFKLADISHTYVRSWLAQLKEKRLSSKSINRKISTLKSYFKFNMKIGVLENTPMAKVISPKVSKRLPVFVKEEDTRRMIQTLQTATEDWRSLNTKILVMVFYATGMRLSELINLKENRVDVGKGQIKVLGKGNKERIIPVSDEVIAMLKDYMKEKKRVFEQTDDILLVTEKGKRLTPKYAWTLVNGVLGEASTLDKKSPHVLRHTFATHLMNNGADLNAVKELLGHSSLAATQVYTHNTIEKLKDIHKKAHPKA